MHRRLAAIFAADLVGYSRLMEQDEDGTLLHVHSAINQIFRPTIENYGGRVVKLMGDGVLAEFPSAIGAVTCAIKVQEQVQQRFGSGDDAVAFRIGINLSDTVFEGGDIFGTGVNVASRVEGLAPPGGICITRSVRDQIRDRIDAGLQDYGQVSVKNIKRAVRVFRVVTDEDEIAALKRRVVHRRWRAGRLAAAAFVAAAVLGFEWLMPLDRPQPETNEAAIGQDRSGTVRVDRRSNLRQGPGTTFPIARTVDPGAEFPLTGTIATASGTWHRLSDDGGQPLFIYAPLATVRPASSETIETAANTNGGFLPMPFTTLDLSAGDPWHRDERSDDQTDLPDGDPLQRASYSEGVPAPPAVETRLIAAMSSEAPVAGIGAAARQAGGAPLWVRIGVDFGNGVYTDCVPMEVAEAHEFALTNAGTWTKVTLSGLTDVKFDARAVARDGAWAIEVWPFSNAWPEDNIVTVPLAGISPGQSGRVFATKRAEQPLNHCGHFAVYAHVVERPPE